MFEKWHIVWEAMRRRQSFTIKDIVADTHVPRRAVTTYASKLVAAGHLRRISLTETEQGLRYQMVGQPGPATPADDGQRSPEGKIWVAARILGHFTLDLIACVAEVDATEVRRYLNWLEKAGYVRVTRRGRKIESYTFIPARYSGPKPPQVQRITQIFDANLGRVVWPGGASHG